MLVLAEDPTTAICLALLQTPQPEAFAVSLSATCRLEATACFQVSAHGEEENPWASGSVLSSGNLFKMIVNHTLKTSLSSCHSPTSSHDRSRYWCCCSSCTRPCWGLKSGLPAFRCRSAALLQNSCEGGSDGKADSSAAWAADARWSLRAGCFCFGIMEIVNIGSKSAGACVSMAL